MLGFGCAQNNVAPTTYATQPGVWKEVKDLQVEAWTSKPEFAQNYIVVCFFNTWCPESRKAIRQLSDIQKEFTNRAVFVGVSDEPIQTLNDFKKNRAEIQIPLGSDTQKRLYEQLGLFGTPHVIVIEPTQHVVVWEGNPLGNNKTPAFNAAQMEKIVSITRPKQ